MAMPWSIAKQKAADYRAGVRDVKQLTALFDACFRIQKEAIEAAGHHIPLVVENVRGAVPWVGRSRWNFGSFHLWGDVPALMPIARKAVKVPNFRFDGSGKSFQTASVEGIKNDGGSWFNIGSPGQKVVAQNPDGRLLHKRNGHGHTRHLMNAAEHERNERGVKGFTPNGGPLGKNELGRKHGSKSAARKSASALIAKIPLVLSRHIAASWKPEARVA
jgi:hypothetical protein